MSNRDYGYEEWLDQQHDEADYELILEEEYRTKIRDASIILADGIMKDKENVHVLNFESSIMAWVYRNAQILLTVSSAMKFRSDVLQEIKNIRS